MLQDKQYKNQELHRMVVDEIDFKIDHVIGIIIGDRNRQSKEIISYTAEHLELSFTQNECRQVKQ